MNAYERYACDFLLADYDADASFNQVMSDIREYSERVTIWEPLEDLTPNQLIDMLRDLSISLSNKFTPKGA